MKTLQCYDCDAEFTAQTKEEILGYLYDHYLKDHQATIVGADESEKKIWMEQFEKDWAAASET
jgi:predicted small metal-binding protein